MPPWRNWLARSAVNRKVGGSSPPGGEKIFLHFYVLQKIYCTKVKLYGMEFEYVISAIVAFERKEIVLLKLNVLLYMISLKGLIFISVTLPLCFKNDNIYLANKHTSYY